MGTKQIEFAETVKLGNAEYSEGDRKSFPEAEANAYIASGWAYDTRTGDTGERVPGAAPLVIDNVITSINER